MPLLAAEKMWERNKVRQFNDNECLIMKGTLYVIRKAGIECNNTNNNDTPTLINTTAKGVLQKINYKACNSPTESPFLS